MGFINRIMKGTLHRFTFYIFYKFIFYILYEMKLVLCKLSYIPKLSHIYVGLYTNIHTNPQFYAA